MRILGVVLLSLTLAAPAVCEGGAESPDWRDRASPRLAGWRSHPNVAALLSTLVPGAGEAYIDEWGTGMAQFGTAGGLQLAAPAFPGQREMDDLQDRVDAEVEEANNRAMFVNPVATAAMDFHLYQVYAAYRDCRLRTGDAGYDHPISDEGLWDLASAPFRPRHIGRVDFWRDLVGVLALDLGIASIVGHFDREDPRKPAELAADSHGHSAFEINFRRFDYGPGVALAEADFVAEHTMVGLGEEAFFRGYLQQELESAWGTVPGWVTANAAFGSLHYDNGDTRASRWYAASSATGFGLWNGWRYRRDGYRLGGPVALHAWWNVLVSNLGFFTEGPGKGRIDVGARLPF
ncbi:MAG: CPBP family intramembrane metalloprotease [Planctomycetes bacterium]|nr:CPBP family intramembrane metalloprotease [Planctomycetota bacterium]